MVIRSGNFVYTNKLRNGMVAVLKNNLTVIGVKNALEAQYKIFKALRIPKDILDQEDSIMDTYHEVSENASGQQKDSIDELFDALMEHVSEMEERAFKAGYLAAKKEECSAVTEHSNRMAR
jgi:hypothetical protein